MPKKPCENCAIPPALATRLVLAVFNIVVKKSKKFDLTNREIQVLVLRTCGHGWKQTAEALKISVRTVRFHSENIMFKVQSSKFTECFVKIFLS